MTLPSTCVAIALSASLLSVTALASAQSGGKSATKTEKLEIYDFPDDKLLSPLGGTSELIITGPPKTVRVLLTRPRTHFVPELLKTIEGL